MLTLLQSELQKLPFKGAFTATNNSKNLANVPYKRTNCLIKALQTRDWDGGQACIPVCSVGNGGPGWGVRAGNKIRRGWGRGPGGVEEGG